MTQPEETIKIGTIVTLKSDPNIKGAVTKINGQSLNSKCVVFINGKEQYFYLSQLEPFVKEKEPSLVSLTDLHSLLTALLLKHPSLSILYSLNTARIEFIPYQFRPALKVIRSDRPRLLIADGVGVGKTIEAGLILRELQARSNVESVLIICPKPLVVEEKWVKELKRFDEKFTQLDGKNLRFCLTEYDKDGDWPQQHKKTIIPFSLFDEILLNGGRGHIGLRNLNPPPHFDLVIVDEAHHIRNSTTFTHQAVRFLCENSEAVIFLTATPIQLGNQDLFTLLNVLRPDLIIDQESFLHMSEPNRFINEAINSARSGNDNWQERTATSLTNASNTSWGNAILNNNPDFSALIDNLLTKKISQEERVACIRKIEDFHTFSRIINRTRRRDIGDFCVRKPSTIEIPFTSEQKDLHDELLSFEAIALSMLHGNQNVRFMMSMIRRQAASCIFGLAPFVSDLINRRLTELQWIETTDSEFQEINGLGILNEVAKRIINKADNLSTDDPKFESLLEIVSEKLHLKNNKLIIFSSFRHTLAYLRKKLLNEGIRLGLVHGEINDDERKLLRQRFELPHDAKDAIDVMLFSEVGCEGLDYQFCDAMVNYDLPWNPMRIEQRIGRIDRRGQKSETVAIYNFITPGTVDADIYNRCLQRIGIFEASIGESEEILGDINREIQNIALNLELTDEERQQKLEQLADNEIRKIHEQRVVEEREHELFGICLPQSQIDKEIQESESYWLTAYSIKRFVSLYFEKRLGNGEYILGEKPLKTLRLSQEAREKLLLDFRQLSQKKNSMFYTWEKWLKGSDPHCPITFDSSCACDNRDAQFIMPLHPLVLQATQFLERDEPIYIALEANDIHIKPGIYKFAVYAWDYKGLRSELKLIPVSEEQHISDNLFNYLEQGRDITDIKLPDNENFLELDKYHHELWEKEKIQHQNHTKEMCSFRRESLRISHNARINLLQDQLAETSNEKIQIMKQAELSNKKLDFEQKLSELDKAENSADIIARPVVFGIIKTDHLS